MPDAFYWTFIFGVNTIVKTLIFFFFCSLTFVLTRVKGGTLEILLCRRTRWGNAASHVLCERGGRPRPFPPLPEKAAGLSWRLPRVPQPREQSRWLDRCTESLFAEFAVLTFQREPVLWRDPDFGVQKGGYEGLLSLPSVTCVSQEKTLFLSLSYASKWHYLN